MKYAKILGLAAMAITAMMAFAGTGSATILTSPAGTTYTSTIKTASSNIELVGEFGTFGTIKCASSSIEGKVEAHGSASTAGGKISSLTLQSCTGGQPTTPLAKPGALEFHTDSNTADGNSKVTIREAVMVVHNTAVGTCTIEAPSTGIPLGTLTGSRNNGGKTAVVTVNSIWRVTANPLCGTNMTLTGSFTVDTPDYLDIW